MKGAVRRRGKQILGGDNRVAEKLAAYLPGTRSPVFTCGPVLSELLQGARGDRDRAAVLESHRALEYADATPAVWVRAGDLAAVLRRSGTTVPLSDLLIAAIAIEQRLEIITADRHFGIIPGVRVQR